MQPLLNIAITAARAAGDIIMRHHEQIDRLKIIPKEGNTFCTEVDQKAEQAIIHLIHKAYPEHGLIAEESGTYREDAQHVWIIDPLDGSSNYVHGFPFYAVSIALRIDQRIEHAVVYDPLRHECFSASRGRGARLNDRRLRVSKQTQLNHALVGIGGYAPGATAAALSENLYAKGASLRRSGSIALDLAYLACARYDAVCSLGASVWDLAAGSLLVQEAGALMSDRFGGEDFLNHGDVIASTPKLFKSFLQTCGSILQADKAS